MKPSKEALSKPDLETFILLFLPESKIERKTPQLELSTIATTIIKALEYIELTTSSDTLFEVFRNLSYPIAVIEPQKENSKGQPYTDTNSHAIYIGVNLDKLKKLSSFPHEINDTNNTMINSLGKFAITIKD